MFCMKRIREAQHGRKQNDPNGVHLSAAMFFHAAVDHHRVRGSRGHVLRQVVDAEMQHPNSWEVCWEDLYDLYEQEDLEISESILNENDLSDQKEFDPDLGETYDDEWPGVEESILALYDDGGWEDEHEPVFPSELMGACSVCGKSVLMICEQGSQIVEPHNITDTNAYCLGSLLAPQAVVKK